MKSRLAQNFNTREPLISSGFDCQCGNLLVQVGECIVKKGIRANEKKTKPETIKLLVLIHHLQVINIHLGDYNTRSSWTSKLDSNAFPRLPRESCSERAIFGIWGNSMGSVCGGRPRLGNSLLTDDQNQDDKWKFLLLDKQGPCCCCCCM